MLGRAKNQAYGELPKQKSLYGGEQAFVKWLRKHVIHIYHFSLPIYVRGISGENMILSLPRTASGIFPFSGRSCVMEDLKARRRFENIRGRCKGGIEVELPNVDDSGRCKRALPKNNKRPLPIRYRQRLMRYSYKCSIRECGNSGRNVMRICGEVFGR
jgi:hypothetical protein